MEEYLQILSEGITLVIEKGIDPDLGPFMWESTAIFQKQKINWIVASTSSGFESGRLLHDKLTDYTKGVVCQLFILNILNMLRRSDFTAVFSSVEGELS